MWGSTFSCLYCQCTANQFHLRILRSTIKWIISRIQFFYFHIAVFFCLLYWFFITRVSASSSVLLNTIVSSQFAIQNRQGNSPYQFVGYLHITYVIRILILYYQYADCSQWMGNDSQYNNLYLICQVNRLKQKLHKTGASCLLSTSWENVWFY